MTTRDLIQRGKEHVADYREEHPEGLSSEMLTMELLIIALEHQMLMSLRCERAVHEQIKMIESFGH